MSTERTAYIAGGTLELNNQASPDYFSMVVVAMSGNVVKIARNNGRVKFVGKRRGLSGGCRGLTEMAAKYGAPQTEARFLHRIRQHAPRCIRCICMCLSICLCPCADLCVCVRM